MNSMILERDFEEQLTQEKLIEMAREGFPCMQIYRVTWKESFFSPAGDKLYCHFKAPDFEALRSVMRTTGSDYRSIWYSDIQSTGDDEAGINVIVERSWEEPVDFEDIAAQEKEGAWCLEAHDVKFLRSLFSQDKKRMLCLYRAPDAESVKQSQIKANMPFDSVWPFKHITPEFLQPHLQ